MDDADNGDFSSTLEMPRLMDAAARKIEFLWGRFVVTLMLCAAVGVAVVEYVRPERYVRPFAASAEIEVRINEQHPPTAEGVRRRALSTANLTGVLHRLIGRDAESPATDEDDVSAATVDRWRRQIAVEVRPGRRPDRRRIRFQVVEAVSTSEAAVLVEAVALQFASESASDRYFERVDRLRAADERVAEATADLLEVVRTRGLTSLPSPAQAERLDRVVEPVPVELGDELRRLTQLRMQLLETLQPAHPDVAAIDARIDSLGTAAAGSSIRRLSAETETIVPLGRPLSTVGLPPVVVTAVERLNTARATAEARLHDLLDPTAIDVPSVSTTTGALNLWELRPFWYGATLFPAFAVAWLAAGGRRIAPPLAIAPRPTSIEPVATPSRPIIEAVSGDDALRTLDQVAEAVGAPVLGVIVRRNHRQAPTFTTK